MIDEKRLIKHLIECQEKDGDEKEKNFLEDMIWLISSQPQVGGWTPVTERLPEEEGRYLCAYGKNLMCVYSFSNDLFSVDDYDFAKYKFEKKKGFYAYDSEWGYWEVDFIKAWQPLPEPFEGSEEE